MTVILKSKDGQALRKLIPLTTLSESAFNELCSQIRIEEGPKGTVLFKQGDQKNEFVYLLAGTISLQAAGMEMDTISGGSEEARFALAHQIPRKVFAVAKDRIRFLRINADFLNSITSKQQDAASYEVSDIPEESSGDWMTTLLKSPIFQRLPAANLQKVLTSMEEIEVKAGELVVKQGEPGDFYYIIKKGRCSLTRRPSRNAKEIKLAELKTTETFGEDSLISGAPRNVNITMLTDGVLLRLSKENFLEYVKKPVIEAVSVDQAIDAVEKGAVLLDVRTPDTFEHGHIDGSRNIPFFSLRMQLSGLDPAKKLIVICEDGNTSEAACFLLIRYALDAVVLAGGFNAVPQQYATSFCRQAQIPAVEPSQESQESLESGESQESPIGSPEVSVADETRALEESRQIIAQLQHQLLIEQEKRKSAEQKQTQSKPNQESDGQELSDLRKQIEALNRECAKAANSAEDYRLRMEAAENKLAESNQVAKGAKQEADRSGAQLNAKLQSLEIELQNRQTELEKALSQSTVNQKEIETLRAKLGDYEIQLGDLDETVRAKSATLEKELSAKRVIEANLSRLEKERSEQIAKLGEKATQAEKRVSALQKELEQSLQTCQLLEKQKGELATAQSGKVETLLEEKQAFEKEASELNHRLETSEAEKRRIEADTTREIGQLQKKLEELEQQIADKNHDLESARNTQRETELEARALQDRIEQIAVNAAAEKQSLEADVRRQEGLLEENLGIQQTLKNTIAELQLGLDESRRENENVREILNNMVEEQAVLHDDVESKQQELESLRHSFSASEEARIKLLEERNRLETEMERLNQETVASREQHVKAQKDLSAKYTALEKEIQALRSKLEESRAKEQKLTKEIKGLTEHSKDLEKHGGKERQAMQSQIDKLEQQKEKLEVAKSGIAEKLRERTARTDGLEQDLRTANARIAELQSGNLELARATEEKTSEIVSLQELLARLQESEEASRHGQEQLAAQHEHSVALAEQIKSDLEQQVQSLENGLAQSSAELEELRSDLRFLTEERNDLSRKTRELEAENAALKDEVGHRDKLSPQLAELEILCGRQQEAMKELEDTHAREIVDAQSHLVELEDRVAALQAENAEIQERITSKSADLLALEESLLAIRKENAVLERRLEASKTGSPDLADNSVQSQELQGEIQRLQEQLKTLLAEKNNATKDLEDLRKQNSELDSLVRELKQHSVQERAADETVDALKSEIEAVREQARGEVQSIKHQLEQSQKTINRLEEELKAERYRVAELQHTGIPRLSLNPALTAVDGDLFDRVDAGDDATNAAKQSKDKERGGIGKLFGNRSKKR